MSVQEEAQEVLSKLPAIRWRVFSRRYDQPVEELTNDNIVMLIILAHEYNRSVNGHKDEWDRFENMSLGELNEFLGLGADDAEPKSEATE